MKKITFIRTALIAVIMTFSGINAAWGQTTLAAGDIAIISENTSTTDKFSFVLLKDIAANTVINFTDNGFTSATTGRTGEGFLTYTAPSSLTAGNVVTWTNGMTIAGTGWSSNAPTSFAFATGGDQLFAFQGSTSNWATQSGITLLYGINTGNSGFISTGSAVAGTSYQPSALTLGTNLVTISADNGFFANGNTIQTSVTVSGSQSSLITLFSTTAKWYTNASATSFPTYSISVSSGAAPTKLVITSLTPITPTAGSTFSVTVQSQDGSSIASNVALATAFSLTTNGNAGIIGGTTTGSIAAGANSVTVTGVTLSGSGTGATITATRSSGDVLTAGVSSTFTVLATAPSAATAVTAGAKTATTVPLTWTNGTGATRIVVARLNATTAVAPTAGTAYAVSSASIADLSNATTGTNNFVVYNGTGSSVTVTGLSAAIAYNFDVYEYNGATSTYNYSAAASTGSTSTLALEPTTQASSLTFTSVTATAMTVGFTAGNGAGRIIVLKSGSGVDSDPIDGATYTGSLTFGSGTQIGTGNYVIRATTGTGTAAITGLTSNTTYYVAIYEYNGASGTYNYLTSSSLTGSKSTLPGPASAVTATTRTNSSIGLSWTNGTGAGRIVVARLSASTSAVAPTAGTEYTANSGDITDALNSTTGTGNVLVFKGTGNTATVSGLAANTQYKFEVYEYSGSGASISYTAAAALGATYTLNNEPTLQASAVVFSNVTATSMTVGFTKGDAANTGRIVLIKAGGAVDSDPVDGTSYTASATFGSGTQIGTGNYVVYSSTGASVSVTGLTANTNYYVAVYEYNSTGAPSNFLTITPATGGQITLVTAPSAPTALAFSSVAYNSLKASFTAPVSAPTGYLVLRRATTAVSGTPAGGTVYTQGQTNIGAGTNEVVYVGTSPWTNYDQTSLLDNTTYNYAVYSYSGSDTQTNYSTALTGSQITTSITAPTANAATPLTLTGFTANWNAVTGATSGYLLDVSTSATFGTSSPATLTEGFESGLSGSYISSTATLGSGVWSFTNGGLDATGTGNFNSGAHGCQLKASTGVATAPSKSNVSTVTFYVKSPNGASTIDVKKIVNGGSAVLVETKNITTAWAQYTVTVNETSSDVQISFVNGASYVLLDDVSIGYTTTVPSFVTGYNAKPISGQPTVSADVTGLTTNTTYYYRLSAVGANSTSVSSNTISAVPVIATPTPKAATGQTGSSMFANWNAVAGATGYILDVYSKPTLSTKQSLSGYPLTINDGAAVSQYISSIPYGFFYYYTVKSTDGVYTSPESNEIEQAIDGTTVLSNNLKSYRIYVVKGSVVVEGASDYIIYNMQGIEVANVKATDDNSSVALRQGVFFVKVAGKTLKVMVK